MLDFGDKVGKTALYLRIVKDFGGSMVAHGQKNAIISHKSEKFRVMADYSTIFHRNKSSRVTSF